MDWPPNSSSSSSSSTPSDGTPAKEEEVRGERREGERGEGRGGEGGEGERGRGKRGEGRVERRGEGREIIYFASCKLQPPGRPWPQYRSKQKVGVQHFPLSTKKE